MAQTTPKMGLTEWDQPLDPYDYVQLANDMNIMDFHDHTPGRGVPIPNGGLATGAVAGSNIAANVITANHLSSSLAQSTGINQTGLTTKGYCATTSDSTGSTSFVVLGTPDQVTVNLPANGLLEILYQATWKESVSGVARAAIHIDGVQLKIANSTSGSYSPTTQAAATGGSTTNKDNPLSTTNIGLVGMAGLGTSYTGDVSTGQVVGTAFSGNHVNYALEGGTVYAGEQAVGGPCYVFASAGSTTVSIRFKVSSGTVTRTNGQLWVRALSYS